MGAKLFLFLTLLFVVLLRYDVNSELELPQNRPQYDYFILSLQWPNTRCFAAGSSCSRTAPQRFTIRGLWPRRFDGTTIPCSSATVADSVFNKYRTDLLRYWPDLRIMNFENNKLLWRREYREHGACCTEMFNADQYFEMALRLAKLHDVLEYLRVANIVPNTRPYAPQRILDAIEARTGFKAEIRCIRISLRLWLEEVRICINYNGRVVNDCRGRAIGCPSDQNVIFTPFRPFTPRIFSTMDQMDEDVELGAEMKGENKTNVMEWKLENNDKHVDGSSSI